ncbi:unnamed protein product, partial [Ectocarpus fasciculatus]
MGSPPPRLSARVRAGPVGHSGRRLRPDAPYLRRAKEPIRLVPVHVVRQAVQPGGSDAEALQGARLADRVQPRQGVLSAGVGGLDLRDQAGLHHLAAYAPDPPLPSAPHPVVQ